MDWAGTTLHFTEENDRYKECSNDKEILDKNIPEG
jgi:hypothetical protein